MAKKRKSADSPGAVVAERAIRLYHLIQLLGKGPQTREELMRRLDLDVRSFYRDLDLLRRFTIDVTVRNRRYTLEAEVDGVLARLPFPDPHLSWGEANQLAKGRSAAHRKLKVQITQFSTLPRGKAGRK